MKIKTQKMLVVRGAHNVQDLIAHSPTNSHELPGTKTICCSERRWSPPPEGQRGHGIPPPRHKAQGPSTVRFQSTGKRAGGQGVLGFQAPERQYSFPSLWTIMAPRGTGGTVASHRRPQLSPAWTRMGVTLCLLLTDQPSVCTAVDISPSSFPITISCACENGPIR